MRKIIVVALAFLLFVPVLVGADTKEPPEAPVAVQPVAPVIPVPNITVTGTTNPVPSADTATAPTPPPDITPIINANPGTFLDSIKNAFSSKLWGVLIGYILMFIVYLIVTFAWKEFPADWLPHMSIVIGVLGNVGWELSIGGKPWWQAILAGLTTGLSAIGVWEYPKVGGKAMFGSIGDKQDAKKAAVAAVQAAGDAPKA